MPSQLRVTGYMSTCSYLLLVFVVTALGIGGAMALRPAFAHRVLEAVGVEAMGKATPGSFYAIRVAPLFQSYCTSCHGERRQKSELRLDLYAYAMRGGRHGVVIRPGDPKGSELLTRVTLPASDDRAMPPEGKTPLSPDDVTVIRLWIAAGASPNIPAGGIKGAPPPVVEVKVPAPDPVRTRRERAPLFATVKALEARYPGLLAYESRDSANLELDAALSGLAFGNSDLAAFLSLHARLVRIDLSGTAITDAAASTLAQMTAVRTLRLMNTKTGDTVIAALVPLRALKSLTLAGTHASAAALAPLRKRGITIHED